MVLGYLTMVVLLLLIGKLFKVRDNGKHNTQKTVCPENKRRAGTKKALERDRV